MLPDVQQSGVLTNRRIPTGILAVVGAVTGAVAFEYVVEHPESPIWWAVEFLVVTSLTVMLLYSTWWLAASELDPAELWDVLLWTVLGGTVFTVLASGVVVHQVQEGDSVAEPTFLTLLLAMVGALFGLSLAVYYHAPRFRPDTAAESAVRKESDDADRRDGSRQQQLVLEILVAAAPDPVHIDTLLSELVSRGSRVGEPLDREAVRDELYDRDLPKLLITGLVEFDRDHRTFSFVGPDSVAECFGHDGDQA